MSDASPGPPNTGISQATVPPVQAPFSSRLLIHRLQGWSKFSAVPQLDQQWNNQWSSAARSAAAVELVVRTRITLAQRHWRDPSGAVAAVGVDVKRRWAPDGRHAGTGGLRRWFHRLGRLSCPAGNGLDFAGSGAILY